MNRLMKNVFRMRKFRDRRGETNIILSNIFGKIFSELVEK